MNVIKKVLGFVKPYIYRYYVAFFCGGVVWMFLDVYVTKGSDASFVSAIMDTVMAAAATIALIKAKKIWDDKGKDHGHKYAMQLLTDVVPKMIVTPKVSDTIIALDKTIKDLNNEFPTFKTLSLEQQHMIQVRRLNYILEKLKILCDIALPEIEKINESQHVLHSQIDICGVGFNKSEAANILMLQFDNFFELQKKLSDIIIAGYDAFFLLVNNNNVVDDTIIRIEKDLFQVLDKESLNVCLSNISDFYILQTDLSSGLKKMRQGKFKASQYFEFN